RGVAFALYDPADRLVRVGIPPPSPLALHAPATALALSLDGETLVTGHDGGGLRAHDAGGAGPRWQRTLGDARIDCVIVPARAPWLVACARSGEVWVLARDRGETLLQLADDEARAIAIAPDERTIALGGAVV